MRQDTTIRIPRWIQLVVLPVLLLVVFLLARPLGHVLFLFLTSAVIAFTLNPLVRDLTRLRLPRGAAVAVVSVVFATAFVAFLVAVGTVVVSESRSAGDRIDAYFSQESAATGKTGAETAVDRLQRWLDDHGLERIQLEQQLNDLTDSIGASDVSGYAQDAISFAQGAALSVILFLFSVVLVIVIAIYMLLDMPRLEAVIDRRFPPRGGLPLTQRIERALCGIREGAGGAVDGDRHERRGRDVDPRHDGPRRGRRASTRCCSGSGRRSIEVIPYIGPWLSAVPPALYALVVDPVGVLWVALLFVFIYQIEGHVVVPNVMASALRLHPLLVIFGLLAGGELYGIPGVLVALPTMAAGRAIWEFFGERIELEPWEDAGDQPLELEVELEPPRRITGS